ncbi:MULTISPECIES: phosphatidylglycerol lysyltransferase domain-containing protein [unclassified Frankia]|uniref:phosphatidylglycerol lysyltransferase domain-containing protein n=1 Tax=unclassified Frankia TaxID=2632575 RepID=UPI001EE4BB22|nr:MULTISPECIES: phosphatidylglycerol lysyltransferase domain-containing protein [unclassified Frankia]
MDAPNDNEAAGVRLRHGPKAGVAGPGPAGGGVLPRLSAWRLPWVPRVVALLTLAIGVIDIVFAVTPEWRSQLADLREVLPGSVSRQAAAFTVLVGMLLVLLARGLRRRKQRAWRAVAILLAASVVLHLVDGLDYEEAAGSAALFGVLLVTRREFQAKGDPTTRWRALGVGVTLTVISVGIGLLLLHARSNHIAGPHPLSAEFEQILWGLVGIPGPLRYTSDWFGDLATRVLLAMGGLTVVTTGYLALRPPQPRPRLTDEDEVRVRDLLDRHGDADSLGYFALRRDKSVVWSPTGKAGVAFRVVSGVMLASGDPLGDSEAWPAAIKEFLREAADHAWTPAVIGCSQAGAVVWKRTGLSVLELGDEAVIDTARFTLQGRSMRNVRQAAGRVERAGYTAVARRMRDIPQDEAEQLARKAAAWRGAETERGFSMALGRLGDTADGDCVAVTASRADPDGGEPQPRALLHFVPWGHAGLSLDAMLRDRSADNGLNEFLIVHTLCHAADLGVTRVSLNFAFLRSALEHGERLGAGPFIRGWRGLLIFLSRWFQIDSLYRFNAKFQPTWQPRYICYPASTDLPRIALAMLEAEAFLVWPSWRHPLTRLTVAAHRHLPRRLATATAGDATPGAGPPLA